MTRVRRELVLVGGGHAHVQLLRKYLMDPLPDDVRVTVVLDVPVAVYSGMVPGFVAGQYRAEELEIDGVPLARRSGARVVLAPAIGVDARARRIHLAGRPSIPYDLASFDIGSTVAGQELPGVRERALPTRPIARFVRRVEGLGERLGEGDPRFAVVGGGAGGVELAFTLQARWEAEGRRPEVTLVHSGERVLEGYPPTLARRVREAAERRGLRLLLGRRAREVVADGLVLDDGELLPCDEVVWVVGAVSSPIFRESGLPTDDRGFVLTRPTLQVLGYDDLFAVGDCATLEDWPETPKAGVFAVRQGPVLERNLRAALVGRRLRRYRPQRDFLMLLNLGDGSALGTKWGFSFAGRGVMRLKDRIDRRFMRRFQLLDPEGELAEELEGVQSMAESPMICGGCAAKLGQSVLERALARLGPPPEDPTVILGLATPDDVAAVRTPSGDVVVSSLDAFRAFVDDPWLVGKVAAVNALSDLWAKGAEPHHALALVAVPDALGEAGAEELLVQALTGIRAVLEEAGVTLIGGHTTTAPELLVGLTVTGSAAEGGLRRLDGLRSGDRILLTKALGTGVILHADAQGRCRGPWLESVLESMLRPNAGAARTATELGVRSATDVTGFGLAGHLGSMLAASGVSARLELGALPALPGALELLRQGFRSTFHPENERVRRGMAIRAELREDPRLDLLFDPQTSGGLLLAVSESEVEPALQLLHAGGDEAAAAIGTVTDERPDGARIEVVAGL